MDSDNLECGLCGTNHTNPDDEWQCLEGQAESQSDDDEPADIDDDYDRNPYDGTNEFDDCRYDSWQDESDLWGEY